MNYYYLLVALTIAIILWLIKLYSEDDNSTVEIAYHQRVIIN